MHRRTAPLVALLLLASSAGAETYWDYQAVNETGQGTWPSENAYPVTLTGVILNNAEEMLDTTANFLSYTEADAYTRGAQWQVFIQPTGASDHAATAVYMGQNYGALFGRNNDAYSYSDAEWNAELARVEYDGAHRLRKGDLVEVVAQIGGVFGGKTNINEMHLKDADKDWTMTLITAGHGLPAPEVIGPLSALDVAPTVPGYDASYPWFDQGRQSGAEHYQGRRVRIDGLSLTGTTAGWGAEAWADRVCTATDGDGREIRLRLPRFSELGPGTAPTGTFSAVGIFNQETGSMTEGRDGYELFVTEIVPEPAGLLLLAAGTAAAVRRRRRASA